MTSLNLSALCLKVQTIAQQAAEVILPHFSTQVAHQLKGDGSPVSQADYAADCFIQEALARLTPDIPVLSEETADQVSLETRLNWSRLWLVDPLDGTRQFIRGNEGFSVNIALIDQHRPILGVVYAPALQEGYAAFLGGGAWHWRDHQPSHAIRVSQVSHPVRVLTGFSDLPRGERTQAFLASLGEYELHEVGSALKACLIAEGKADVYPRYGQTSEWDTAASQIVLEEAGGALIALSGQPLGYNQRDSLENPPFIALGQKNYPWHFLAH